MVYVNCFVLDGFADRIFSDLYMAESLCSHVGGPKYAGAVVVVNGCGLWTEG